MHKVRTLGLAALIAVGCGALPVARAADACRATGGVGGTGAPLIGSEDRVVPPGQTPVGGVGGTGVRAGAEQEGTPAGFYGTVTAFGSICVDGVEIQYDETTPTEIDGEPSVAKKLEIGQVVRVDAVVNRAGAYEARDIAVLDAVVGPVTRRDAEHNRFWVMGQAVRVTSETNIVMSGTVVPPLGTKVRISGIRNADGEVMASRLAHGAPEDPVYLLAPVTQIDGRVIEMAGTPVDVPTGIELSDLAEGEELAVRGTWDGDSIVGETFWRRPKYAFSSRARRIRTEGYLLRCESAERYVIEDIEVVQDGGIGSDWLGRRVYAEGDLDESGVMRVTSLHAVASDSAGGAVRPDGVPDGRATAEEPSPQAARASVCPPRKPR